MTSQVRVPDRHLRHHRHQSLDFNGLGVTQSPLRSSPASPPPPRFDIDDAGDDASVTHIQAHPSPHNKLDHKAFSLRASAGDDGDAKIPTPVGARNTSRIDAVGNYCFASR